MRILIPLEDLLADLTRRAKACEQLASEQPATLATEAERLRNKGAGYSHAAELVSDWGNRNDLFSTPTPAADDKSLRRGIPKPILRQVHPDWQAEDGWHWRSSALTEEGFLHRTIDDELAREFYSTCGWRPTGATWFHVEKKAAALIGSQDAAAGTERRGWYEVLSLLRNGIVIPDSGIETQAIGQAYHDAYTATSDTLTGVEP